MATIDRAQRKDYFKPRRPSAEIASRKELFTSLNKFIMAHGGWTTSMPGAAEVTMETLPDSTLPDEMRGLGYDITEIGEGQGLLAAPIEERLTLTSCGVFEPLTLGSTKPVVQIRTHAGIAWVLRYSFIL
jgi:hypothetical protein